MNVNLQENLIKYHNLRILSFKENIDVDKKWLKKLRKAIIHFLDTEMTFLEFYKILKSVEKENFGFCVKTLIHERLSLSEKEKVSYQVVDVCVNYIGYSKTNYVMDTGYGEVSSYDTLRIKTSKNIKPEEIISISNLEILNAIKRLDKKVYNHIVDIIIEKLYERDCKQEEVNIIANIISERILDEYGVSKCRYSFFEYSECAMCIENDKGIWKVYYAYEGSKCCPKKYQYFIEACWELLDKLCDIKGTKFLKKRLILELSSIY